MTTIDIDQRAALSKLLRGARVRLGWSQEELADRAELALRDLVGTCAQASEEERTLWRHLGVTRHHVAGFEGFRASPLSNLESRSRLLGIVTALKLNKATVNRIAGGI